MSTPGSLSIPSKGTNQPIPATGPVDGGTLLRFVDAEQGINTDRLNGAASIRCEVDIYKAKNELASLIHRSGGYNRWSDGTIR